MALVPDQSGAEFDRLYERLLVEGRNDMDMRELSEAYGYAWQTFPNDEHNSDPNYFRLVRDTVWRGLGGFLVALELTCMSLSGMAENQRTDTVCREMLVLRSACMRRMGTLLSDTECGPTALADRVRMTIDEYVPRAVERYKTEVRTAVLGIRALSSVAAAVNSGRDVAEVLQQHYANAHELCARPPPLFLEQLRMQHLDLGVVRTCFIAPDSTSLPPAMGRALDILSDYFAALEVNDRFQVACVAAMQSLRLELDLEPSHERWGNVAVHTIDSEEVHRARADAFGRVYPLPVPEHTSTPTRWALVVLTDAPHALRPVRFLRALAAVVEVGALRPCIASASVLLPSVARACVERRERQPTATATSTAPNAGLLAVAPMPAPAPMLAPAPVPAANTAEATLADLVPVQLRRDHAILSALQTLLPPGGGSTSVRSIGKMAMRQGVFPDKTAVAVTGVVSAVVRKCIQRVHASALQLGDVAYVAPAPGARTEAAHVRTDEEGTQTLLLWLEKTLAAMRCGDAQFARAWHGSRSTRCKAKKNGSKAHSLQTHREGDE